MDRFSPPPTPPLVLVGHGRRAPRVQGLPVIGRAPLLSVKHNQLFGPVLRSLHRVGARTENRAFAPRTRVRELVTGVSLLLCCILTGAPAVLGWLPGAVWLFTHRPGSWTSSTAASRGCSSQQTAAGALFDSVSDRWGELSAFTGCAWYLHDSPWLLAVTRRNRRLDDGQLHAGARRGPRASSSTAA